MFISSLWLGVIEATCPKLCPKFFEVDLAPHILEFLGRRDGGYCGELMRAADFILCTVLGCFVFSLPLLLAVEGMPFLEDVKRSIAEYPATTSETREALAQFNWDGPTQFELGFFLVVFIFCILCLKVLWPRFFEGKSPQHDIESYRLHRNGWRILIARQESGGMFSLSL